MLVSEVREVSRSKEAVFITHGIDLLANFGRCHFSMMLGAWQICNAKLTSRLRNRLSAPSAECRMRFDGADIRQQLPAAFAFGVGADFDGGGEL